MPVGQVTDEEARAFLKQIAPVVALDRLIRVGPNGDGGYLVPEVLDQVDACFSPGVADNIGFERSLCRFGIRSHCCDASVDGLPDTLDIPATFDSLFIGHSSSTGTTSLGDWVERHERPDDRDYLLQIDVEGAEYEVLLSAPPDLLRRFSVIVVELHWFHYFLTPLGYRLFSAVFGRLANSHVVAHLHQNNAAGFVQTRVGQVPRLMEVTFLRRDLHSDSDHRERVAHELDSSCYTGASDIDLDSAIYSRL